MLTLRIVTVLAVSAVLSSSVFSSDRLVQPGEQINVIARSDQSTPFYVTGNLAKCSSEQEALESALGFLESHKSLFRVADPRSELRLSKDLKDRLGNRHLRLRQLYHDIPVIGGDMAAHFTPGGELVALNGYYEPNIELDPAPAITAEQALIETRSDLAVEYRDAPLHAQRLVVFPWQGEHHLCHELEFRSLRPICRWIYYVDAHTGDIVYKANLIKAASEIGTGAGVMGGARNHIDVWSSDGSYYLQDHSRQLNNDIHGHGGQMPDGNTITTYIAGSNLPGDIATDADNVWSSTDQRAAVDAHVYGGLFYDWVLREFGRNGFDGVGGSMISSVDHTVTDCSAWYIGSHVVYMAPSYYCRSFAAGLDIVGHEWGHGVTEFTSDMVYRWETGALDEAFSDWFGTAFEFAHDSLDVPDWYIGENGQIYGNGYMFLANPEAVHMPSTYQGTYWVPCENCVPTFANDFCGVHTNCGVGHKWFYLLSEGGTFGGETINGIGIGNAIKVAYQANAYYWTQTVDFLNGAIGTWFAAMDLDPTGVWASEALAAWRAVGIDFSGMELAFHPSSPMPRTVVLEQSSLVEVSVTGNLGYLPEPGTGQIHISEDGGEFIAFPMTEVAPNHYQYELTAELCNQPVRYYFSAEADNGQRRYFPDPSDPYHMEIISRIDTAFADDFEADLGWTVTGNALEGEWERGVPAGDGSYGEPASDYDGSGQCYLTGNNGLDEDVDAGRTDLMSPTFDMEGRNGLISFAFWYNVRCAPSAGEVMWIYISNDDGVTWSQAKFLGPQLEAHGGWLRHEFEVADILEPTSQMKLMFRVVDWGFPSCVEAGLDDVLISRYICEREYCCGLYDPEDRTGNVDQDPGNIKDLSDILLLAAYAFLGGDAPQCMAEMNVSGDAGCIYDLNDVLDLASYSYLGGSPPAYCLPECEL